MAASYSRALIDCATRKAVEEITRTIVGAKSR
jgi:hypothetical protein